MKIVILGNGVSGITAARWIRKRSDHEIVVISDESDYFFSRTALMYVFMGHLRWRDIKPYEDWFWAKNRIQLVRARVTAIDFFQKKMTTNNGESIPYDRLVLALGSVPNKPGWPGQELDGVCGFYSAQDVEAIERHSAGLHRAVIVGGGLTGTELAEMLHSRGIPVTFLVREPDFCNHLFPAEESAMISRRLREHGIDLRTETELTEILGDGRGKCRAVVTSKGETLECGFVGLTAGVSPNVAFLKNTALEINRGILVDEYLETNQPGVFAIGDCAELRRPPPGRRPIEAVWYTGRLMGEAVARTLTGVRTAYEPGIWFNSAKFFDLEYQVYGDIQSNVPERQAALYWEHPGGKKSIRIHYDRRDGTVRGFNLMGVRYRHAVCDRWLRRGERLENVLQNLGLANFDPEFAAEHEAELVRLYNLQTGNDLRLKRKRGLEAVLAFLR